MAGLRTPPPDGFRGQVGRRPTPPGLLVVIAVLWIAVGVWALVGLQAAWKLVPAIFFIGVGVLYARAAAVQFSRRRPH